MMAAPVMMEAGRPGFLKMHLKKVHIEYHQGPALERMSPQVVIKMNDFVWRSNPKMHAGKTAEWDFEELDMEVFNHEHEMFIEVRDHEGAFDHPPIGVHRCRVGFFAQAGTWEDWLPLRKDEFEVGKIHFKTHFRHN